VRADGVTPELRKALFARDLGCVLAFLQPGHVCRDQWGYRMTWDYQKGLTVEHVKDHSTMGRRAPSDMEHCVILCGGTNVDVPSKTQRTLMREYLKARQTA
jgi:hypothetical protein